MKQSSPVSINSITPLLSGDLTSIVIGFFDVNFSGEFVRQARSSSDLLPTPLSYDSSERTDRRPELSIELCRRVARLPSVFGLQFYNTTFHWFTVLQHNISLAHSMPHYLLTIIQYNNTV